VTVAKAYRLLHSTFETAAEEDRIIARNPCHIDGAGKEESDERQTVPLPVVFKIAETVPVRYRALVLLATFADMRWGELVGLRRENIDLEACEIRIAETLAQLDKGGLRPQTPKSRAGKRTVAFPAEIAPEILASGAVRRAGGAGLRLRRREGRQAAPLQLPQVGLEQSASCGRSARPPFSRPTPHRWHAFRCHGRDSQRADGTARPLQRPGGDDLPARHPRP
jgi:integrase